MDGISTLSIIAEVEEFMASLPGPAEEEWLEPDDPRPSVSMPAPSDPGLTWIGRELQRINDDRQAATSASALEKIVISLFVCIVVTATIALYTDALIWKIAVFSLSSVEFPLLMTWMSNPQRQAEVGRVWSIENLPAGYCTPSRQPITGRNQ
jgi:hypothetical protein